ncbi:hypothetical protein BD310DRAFT_574338 [Dichomitus squalens]|uniref:Uncharacterized protein n=1 Tax=Dichomitus squalens TaxID=114155 RepID=A0A4Q9PRY4_9APHY|nr:hypothetical protein BD310DRAFT_574338 [Dichomitus squalens]
MDGEPAGQEDDWSSDEQNDAPNSPWTSPDYQEQGGSALFSPPHTHSTSAAPPYSASSSLASALTVPAPRPRPVRTEPPSWYNPYPYPRNWTFKKRLTQQETWDWNHVEDQWMHDKESDKRIVEVRDTTYQRYIAAVAARQTAARQEWEESQLLTNPRMVPGPEGESEKPSQDVYFETFYRDKGIPMGAVIAGRRELQHCLRDANKLPFKGSKCDTIKWPAYPDYQPDRRIFITTRTGKKKVGRRAATKTEFIISLGSFFAQYYAEVSKMEPDPAFAHLALGPGEGKISLYALRLMGVRAGPGDCFDLDVELDTVKPQTNSDDDWDADPVDNSSTAARSASPVAANGDLVTSTSASASASTSGLSYPAASKPDADPDPDEDRAKTPPWAGTLPVTCTVAPPPQIPHQNYFSHVDPQKLRLHPLPAWPDVYSRR